MDNRIEYFNLGVWESLNFIDHSKRDVSISALNSYLDSFCIGMFNQNMYSVNFASAQVVNLNAISKEDYSSLPPSDALGVLYKNTTGAKINGQTVFSYIIDRLLHTGNIDSGISFGGESAKEGDWDFGFDTNSPEILAKLLADWANKLKLKRVDFNVESVDFSKNNPEKLVIFFTTLKDSFAGYVTLTVTGNTNIWGLEGSVFKPFFQKGVFKNMFDGLNLVLYNGKYYLNGGEPPIQDWDLYKWLSELQLNSGFTYQQAAPYVHVGLNAQVDYTKKSSSAGPLACAIIPKNATNGTAAKMIFFAIETDLEQLVDEDILLGAPFYWNSNADYTVSSSNNYQSQFFKNSGDFELDFQSLLKGF